LAEEADLFLPNLKEHSLQGDSMLVEWMRDWGVESRFEEGGLRIIRRRDAARRLPAEMDFFYQPDLAQTFAVLAAALGHPLRLSGLQTLRIKETDRLAALKTELQKVGVQIQISDSPSLLSMCGDVRINRPEVVEKSFPGFWKSLDMLR